MNAHASSSVTHPVIRRQLGKTSRIIGSFGTDERKVVVRSQIDCGSDFDWNPTYEEDHDPIAQVREILMSLNQIDGETGYHDCDQK
jgi:hypothetical protein